LAARRARLVIAVEPDPENFKYLKRNVRLNRAENVVLVNKVLSNYVGEGFMSGRETLKALSHQGVPVKVATIDEVIRELGLDAFDILKMDVEGAELNALSGNFLFLFLQNVRELTVKVHDEMSYKMIYDRLISAGFYVKEWGLSSWKVLKRILANFRFFVDAELKTGLCTTALTLKYMLSSTPHPVPAAQEVSGTKLLYAVKSRRSVALL